MECFVFPFHARGVLPYISHKGMPAHRVGVFRRFGLKTGIDFAHFGLESGAFQFQMSKKERHICKFEWKLRNLFCCYSNLSNDDGHNYTYMPGLKTGMDFTGQV